MPSRWARPAPARRCCTPCSTPYPDHRVLLTHMTPTGRATAAELYGQPAPRVQSAHLPLRHPVGDLGLPAALPPAHRHPDGNQSCGPTWCRPATTPAPTLAVVPMPACRPARPGFSRIGLAPQSLRPPCPAIGAQARPTPARRSDRPEPACGDHRQHPGFRRRPPRGRTALAADFRNRLGPQREIPARREHPRGRGTRAFARFPPEVLLVLVPRHPDRFDEVARLVMHPASGC